MRVWILFAISTLAIASLGVEEKENGGLSRFHAKIQKQLEGSRTEVELTLDVGADKGQGERVKRSPLASTRQGQTKKGSLVKTIGSGLWKTVKAISRNGELTREVDSQQTRRVTKGVINDLSTLDVNVVDFMNQTYLGVLELQTGGTTDVVLYNLTSRTLRTGQPSCFRKESFLGTMEMEICMVYVQRNHDMKIEELMRQEVIGAQSLEMMEIEGNLFLLPLLKSYTLSFGGWSPLLGADLANKQFVQVQSISTPHGKSAVLWKGSGDQANDAFLALAPEMSRGSAMGVTIGIYQWQSTYFDQFCEIQGSNPQAITHFEMLNNHFLEVANYRNDSGTTSVHSEIFKYLHSEGKFVSFQKIQTQGAKDIKYFEFRREERVDRFLAIANHCDMDEHKRNVPNYEVESVIMKYDHDQHRFVPFQSISTNGAMQFLPILFGKKNYLVLLELHRLRIFQYDDEYGYIFSVTNLSPVFEHSRQELYSSMRLRAFPSGPSEEPIFSISSILPKQYNGSIFSISANYSIARSGVENICSAGAMILILSLLLT